MGLLMLAAQVGTKTAEAVVPALSTLEKSIIGAVLVVSWGLTILAVWQLIKVQTARVNDQKESSKRIEKLVEKMTSAFTEMKTALEGLKQAEQNGQLVIQGMKQSFDMFLMSRGIYPTPEKKEHGPLKVVVGNTSEGEG